MGALDGGCVILLSGFDLSAVFGLTVSVRVVKISSIKVIVPQRLRQNGLTISIMLSIRMSRNIWVLSF